MTKKKSYRDLLKDELLEIARKLGLTNLSRLKKEEIADLVEKAAAKQERAKTSQAAPRKSPAASPAPRKSPPAPPTPPASRKSPPAPSAPARRSMKRTSSTEPATEPQAAATEVVALGPVSAQSGAVASKFTTTTTQYRPAELLGVDEGMPELPETYGDNRIVLLPRDLSWLFAYWDLTSEYKEAARAAGGSVLALRLYDVTGIDFDGTNAHAMHEHECAEWARSWYIPTPTPDRDYVVEIGYRGADQWFPLARSNRVSVPSDQPSTWIKDDFITIRFDEDLREIRDRLSPPPELAGPPAPGTTVPAHTIFDDGEMRIMVGGAFLPPSGAPTWPPFSGAEQVLPGSQAYLPGSQAFLPGSLGVAGSVAFLPGSLGVAGSVAFLPGSVGMAPGSLYQLPSSQSYYPPFQLPSSPGFLRPPGALAGGEPGGPGGHDAAQGRGAAAAAGAGEPGSASEPRPEPPVILAMVEMVISGRSVPGAELRIAGRSIPMGPDGAFSLRVTVPEGLRELPIEARWAHSADSRRIMLKLGRESD